MINLEDVKTLSLKPGQVLVAQTETLLPHAIRQQLQQYFQGAFPRNKIIVIDKSIQLLVVDEEPSYEC